MWKSDIQLNQLKRFQRNLQLNQLNQLKRDERDYMIDSAIRKLNIAPEWYGAVKKAANYLPGDKYWTLVEYAKRAKRPDHYFIRAVNRELSR